MPKPRSYSDPAFFKAMPQCDRYGKRLTKYEQYVTSPTFAETTKRISDARFHLLTEKEAEKAKMYYK